MKIHPYRYYKCDDDDKPIEPVDTIYINGYDVGDRLLEGVMFEFEWNDEVERYIYRGSPGNKEYLQKLNMKYWSARLSSYVDEADIAYNEDETDELVRGAMIYP